MPSLRLKLTAAAVSGTEVAVSVLAPALLGTSAQLVAGRTIVQWSLVPVPPSLIAILPLGLPAPGRATATVAPMLIGLPRAIDPGDATLTTVVAFATLTAAGVGPVDPLVFASPE